MKLLLFGGTFDPPHLGHAALLRHAIEAVAPDRVIVMPAGTPPHKAASQTPGTWRYAMCAGFLDIDARIARSRYEIDRPGKSYTVCTVEYLKQRWPGATIYLAIGSDMLLSFTEWYQWQRLLRLVTLVAQSRDDAETAAMQPAIEALRAAGGKVLFLPVSVLRLSSSELRTAAAEGEDISSLVLPGAQQVITMHHLYRKGIPAVIDADYCKKLAKRNLSEKRYTHTLNVAKLAKKLAKRYGADPDKAQIAGLLHDICKERPKPELLQMLRENAIMTDNAAEKPAGIWHAAAAMVYLKNELGIEDEEILGAVRWHTSGRAKMTTLEKIIYMADMCSAERSYREVDELRALLKVDLDRALTKALAYSIGWLKEEKRDIDPDSAAALAWMKQEYCARN